MRRTCGIFIKKKEILIVSAAMTTHGFEMAVEPVFRLNIDDGEGAVGEVVPKALDSYRTNVVPPPLETVALTRFCNLQE